MKKILTISALAVIFTLTVVPALALTSDQLGLQYGTALGLGTRDIRNGVMSIIQYALGFLGIIAIVLMLYGGFLWLTSAGNEEKVGQAKKVIIAAVIGLVIIFVSYALATFVITQLISATT
jgi:Zn-dependent protease with chaperone function